METAVSPIEQVTGLFDISPLVDFFISVAGVVITYQLAKKGFYLARSAIKGA